MQTGKNMKATYTIAIAIVVIALIIGSVAAYTYLGSNSPTPTPTPTSSATPTPTLSVNMGTLSFCIKDSSGNLLSNAIVSSTVQPEGMSTLFEISNASGYVTFKNATAGSYTFTIVKEGYPTQNETLDYNAQPLTLNIAVSATSGNGNNSDNSLIIIVAVIVTGAVAAVIIYLFVIKRKQSPNVKKLQELKKQMKPQFET